VDIEWAKAATEKNVNKTVSYYSDDATVMPPNNPLVTGRSSVTALWRSILMAPGFAGGWKPTTVEVARSSDLAYVTGTYEFAQNDATGKPAVDKGKYVEFGKNSRTVVGSVLRTFLIQICRPHLRRPRRSHQLKLNKKTLTTNEQGRHVASL
jgi:ketosteroid isomerase-like protein